MAKVERNAPCSCGSGKKYKRGCGAERDLAVLPAFGKAESERAVDLLLDLASSPLFSGALEAAEDEFFENTFEDATAEQTQAASNTSRHKSHSIRGSSTRAKRRKRPGLDDATFFKEAVPRIGAAWLARFTWQLPTLMTSDGEALQAQTLVYDVVDRDALLLALEANPEFDTRDDGGAEYVWLAGRSTIAGTGSTILGSLTLEHSRLQAFVMSDERAERLRHLLERIAPGAVRYWLTDIHDVTKASQATSPPPKSSGIPPEIESQVLAEFTERYYRAWLDEDIPALGNRTSRNAVKLKTQRAKVAALLREIERHPPHESGVDIAWLWEELKLTDLR